MATPATPKPLPAHAGNRFWVSDTAGFHPLHTAHWSFSIVTYNPEQFIPHHPITTTFWTFGTLMQRIFLCANQDSAQFGCPPAFNIAQRSLTKTNSLQQNTSSHKPPSDSLSREQALRTQTQTKMSMAGQTAFLIL